MNTIAENIEAIRKKVGVKQEVLAERMGISQGTYSGYLTQNQDIKYGLILDIANNLNVPVVDIIIITYPDVYVLKTEQCQDCVEKDKTIKNLNEYIEMLKKKNRVMENEEVASKRLQGYKDNSLYENLMRIALNNNDYYNDFNILVELELEEYYNLKTIF